MANHVEVGGTYVAAIAKSGFSQRGAWRLLVVDNGDGKDGITCFVSPNTVDVEVNQGESFTVKSILAYNQKKRKNDKGEWIPANNVTIDIEKANVTFDGTDPFNVGTNPFEDDPFKTVETDDGELPF